MAKGYIKSENGTPIEIVDAKARSKMHEHENKSVIDAITSEDIEKWNQGGSAGVSTPITVTLDVNGDIVIDGIGTVSDVYIDELINAKLSRIESLLGGGFNDI